MTSLENMQQTESPDKKNINLNFCDTRRHSFLPENWSDEKRETNVRNIRVLEVTDDDDLFLYMQSSSNFQERPMQKFCTGSKYLGQWNKLGIAGKGVYKFPHGVIYDGYFNRNGEFHGTGILVYPNGQRIEGTWRNGKLGSDNNFITKGGIVMNKNYCLMPDRRFQVEVEDDFNPAGQEYVTDEHPPPRKIPEGCYDVVEGFFNPKIKTVIAYPKEAQRKSIRNEEQGATKYLFSGDEQRNSAFTTVSERTNSDQNLESLMKHELHESMTWIPSTVQEEWIIKNCRKGWDEATGYRPDLYEEWTKGGYDGLTDREIDVDSKCQLKFLNLHKKEQEESDKRLVSFVQNVVDQRESETIEKLSKMFRSMPVPKIDTPGPQQRDGVKMYLSPASKFSSVNKIGSDQSA